MISINILVEEALERNGTDVSFYKLWKKHTNKTIKGSIVNKPVNTPKETPKKKSFEHTFNSFDALKEHADKRKDNDIVKR